MSHVLNPHINVLYVYGILMRGETPPIDVPGSIFDLGSFPAGKIIWPLLYTDVHGREAIQKFKANGGSTFKAERIEVDDETLLRYDYIEGYRKDRPQDSFYIRKQFLDGWIYHYNQELRESQPLIKSGCWRTHKEGKTFPSEWKARAAEIGAI